MDRKVILKTQFSYEAHNQWLSLYIDEVADEIDKSKYNDLLSDNAKSNIYITLFNQLFLIAYDCLNNSYIKELISINPIVIFSMDSVSLEDKNKASNALLEKLMNGGKEYFDKDVPQLSIELYKRCSLFKEVLFETLDRIFENASLISNTFFNGDIFDKIIDFQSGEVELHDNGRFVSIITTSTGKFVYKPHSLKSDEWFSKLTYDYFNNVVHTPKIISIDDKYGFSEFIENKPASTSKEAKKYYYNFGCLFAIFEVFGSSDFHKENILANGIYPVPVDFETIIKTDIIINPYKEAEDDFDISVVKKGVLPHYDFIKKEEYSPLLDVSDKNPSLPIINSVKTNVLNYVDDFCKGYEDTYLYCLDIKDKLIKRLDDLNDSRIRILPLSTNIYGAILINSYKKNNLINLDTRKSETKRFYEICKHNEKLYKFAKSEEEGILQGDIPSYYTKANEKNVYYINDIIAADYLNKTPIDNAKKCLNVLSKEKLNRDLIVIKNSIDLAIIYDDSEYNILIDNCQESIDIDKFKNEIDQIFIYIKDKSFRLKNGKLAWLNKNSNGFCDLMRNDLYEGTTGIALFLANYISFTDNEVLKKEAFSMCDECLDMLADLLNNQINNISSSDMNSVGFLGLGGIVYALINIKKIINNIKVDDLLDSVQKYLLSINYKNITNCDVFGGLSGLLEVLCSYEELYENKNIKTIIKDVADRILDLRTLKYKDYILWDTCMKGRPISGWGHGEIGVIKALTLAYDVLKDDKYINAINDAYRFEKDAYSQKHKTWLDYRESENPDVYMHGLCSGAPGIGNCLLAMRHNKEKFDDFDINLERVIKACKELPLNYRDHICCGNGSILDFLINAYDVTCDNSCLSMANKLMNAMYNRKQKYGNYIFSTHRMHIVYNLSLYQGIAGVGYEMIKLIKRNNVKKQNC